MIPSPGRARWRSVAGVMLALLLLGGAAARAASPFFGMPPPEPQGFVPPQNLAQPAGVSPEQAADSVQRQTGGRVLSTTPVVRGGAPGYEVRVLVDGKRVKDVFVDQQGNVRGQR